MKCALCGKEILKYDARFNQLKISDETCVDICLLCVDKFLEWQQATFAKLYPTKIAKDRYSKRKEN